MHCLNNCQYLHAWAALCLRLGEGTFRKSMSGTIELVPSLHSSRPIAYLLCVWGSSYYWKICLHTRSLIMNWGLWQQTTVGAQPGGEYR